MVPNAGGLPLDDLLAVALLTFFGVQTLRSAADADSKAAEEKEEAQEVVSAFGSGEARRRGGAPACLPPGRLVNRPSRAAPACAAPCAQAGRPLASLRA